MRSCPKCGQEYGDQVEYCSRDGTRLGAHDRVDSADATDSYRPGSVLGSYRLVERIGSGGMGHVWSAEHVRLGRRVGIKLLRRKYGSDPQAVKRFFREARAVNRIAHEHIVQITDFIEEEGGDNYYVMELLTGGSLGKVIEEGGPLPVERAVSIALQVATTLQAVHAAGVIHRDLKPDNIFLTERDGQSDYVKLLDFGVAKIIDAQPGDTMIETVSGALLGTPAYMAPEQTTAKPVDERTDVFALGVILYEMLSGVRPFLADSLGDLVIQHLTARPPRPGDVTRLDEPLPAALEELVFRCLQPQPDQRYADMGQVAERLAAVLAGHESPLAVVAGRRGRMLWLGAGVLLLAAGAVAVPLLTGADPAGSAVVDGSIDAGLGDARPAGAGTVDAGPADLVPDEVRLSFSSSPPGAEVFLPGGDDALGATPFEWTAPRSERPQVFEFRLPGHQVVRQSVPLSADIRLVVNLLPEPHVAAADAGVADARPAPVQRRRVRRRRVKDRSPAGQPTDRPRPSDPVTPVDKGPPMDNTVTPPGRGPAASVTGKPDAGTPGAARDGTMDPFAGSKPDGGAVDR